MKALYAENHSNAKKQPMFRGLLSRISMSPEYLKDGPAAHMTGIVDETSMNCPEMSIWCFIIMKPKERHQK